MDAFQIELIQTVVALVIYLLIKTVSEKIIEKAGRKFSYAKPRIKITKKIIQVVLFIIWVSVVFFIWGVNQSELAYFITTMLTVLGVALFAQWSLLSNITASIIIFFYHPVKIGDTIKILDKEYNIEGKISDIGIFFLIIKTIDNDRITVPTNVFLQKMVQKIIMDDQISNS
jgi:small-conductance mechanosensitive channel